MGESRARVLHGAALAVVCTCLPGCFGTGDDDDDRGGSGGSSAGAGAVGSGAAGAGASPGTGGSGGTSGQGGSAGKGSGGAGGAGAVGGSAGSGTLTTSNKLDLLFVIDNSISMGAKQQALSASLPVLVSRMLNPRCIAPDGTFTESAGPDVPCPAGSERELDPVKDMHVGVITTSLGARGGTICDPAQDPSRPSDDLAQLLPSVRPTVTFQGTSAEGFLVWNSRDPNAAAESDRAALIQNLQNQIAATGENGCGYESPLEALYRFLIDPEPPLSVTSDLSHTTATGPNTTLLSQRAAFLRPDSAVMAVVLTDEDDCSIIDQTGSQGWIVGYAPTNATPLPRARAICASDPNSECCSSCATALAAGCVEDPLCETSPTLDPVNDNLNLRCFEQKRRYGFDLLYPIERYASALKGELVPSRSTGQLVANPLYVGGRTPDLVNVAMLVGVPWQDLASDPGAAELELLSAQELTDLGRWEVILGDPAAGVAPTDPFMIASIEPRTGNNPITNQPIVATTSTDPTATINGHEHEAVELNDLQYACTFELPAERYCVVDDYSCQCPQEAVYLNRSICQPPGGGPTTTTQYYGHAYPSLRQLELAKSLGEQAVVASICPRQLANESAPDYGYVPTASAIMARLGSVLVP